MKWLGVFIVGCFTIIAVTIIVYYNLIQDTHISLGIGIVASAFTMFFMVRKIEVEK